MNKFNDHLPYIAACTCFSEPDKECAYCGKALALSAPPAKTEYFPGHAKTMKPGQTKWLLNWHEAREVVLVRKSLYTDSWESTDRNGNQFFWALQPLLQFSLGVLETSSS